MAEKETMDELIIDLDGRIKAVIEFKDEAIKDGVSISEELINRVNKIKVALHHLKIENSSDKDNLVSMFTTIDVALGEISNLMQFEISVKGKPFWRRFDVVLTIIISIMVLPSGFFYAFINDPDLGILFWFLIKISVFAIFLGFLGSALYILLTFLGVVSGDSYRIGDRASIIIRLMIGPLVGWVVFVAVAKVALDDQGFPGVGQEVYMVPFLVGFSTKLVIAFTEKFIKGVELFLGIEEKKK